MEDEFVKKYFKETAKDFDNIYDNRGGLLKKIINKVLRKGMHERVALTLQECSNRRNKTLLDIGCGSGRVALLLAEKGVKVTGVDYSSEMIDLANGYLKEYKTNTNTCLNVKYACCDFMKDFNSNELFDITLALGVFDYVKDPIPLLRKIKNITKEKMLASYPAKFTPQMPLRKLWLWTKNCPVYFYTKKELESMHNSIGITDYEIIKVAAGYLVKANLSKR